MHIKFKILNLIIILSVFLLINQNQQYTKNENFISQKPTILFTCTTFLSKKNKYNELKKALHTFLKFNKSNKIKDYIIINEYGENTDHYIQELKTMYPFITFINKNKNQQGQAYSLNMIIDILKKGNYKYWLHWEESWYSTAPFIDEIYDIMEKSNLDQLQLIKRWHKQNLSQKYFTRKNYKNYYEIIYNIPSILTKNKSTYTTYYNNRRNRGYPYIKLKGEWIKKWPLFSLSPGIDKVSTILKTGYFDTDKRKWPVTFEFEFSIKWLLLGARKGVLSKEYNIRNKNHKSTYYL